jgi:hypothetical protein
MKTDGHLARLEELLGNRTSARVALDPPRSDFPLTIEPKLLLRTQSGEAYAAGLIRADLKDVRSAADGTPATLAARVVTQAVGPSGQPLAVVERPVRPAVAPDGALTASYGVTLKPGRHTLRIGLVVGDSISVTSTTVEVPDFEAPGLKLGSLIVYPQTSETGAADAQGPYAAFAVGSLRLQPRFGNVFSKADSLQAVCVLYGGKREAATGKPSLKARFSFVKDGRPVARGEEETFDTPIAVASVGPVPLTTFAPGRYVARVEATDVVAGSSATQETSFEIAP